MPIELAAAIQATRLAELRAGLDALWPAWPPAVTLEIGCGHGHFLNAYAQAHPEEFCLGIDLIADRIERAQKKAHRARLTNLAFFQAEARLLLEALPAKACFSRIFVLFPDPWPKRRHHKNRLMQPEFLTAMAHRASPGSKLHFRTDHEPYFTAATETVNQHPEWQLVSEPWPFEFVTVFQSRADTHYSFTADLSLSRP
jgi:tRNA (guanine-N7-)-methyltransferase